MPRFAANLSLLFTELPFLERFEAAARHGFDAVEFLFPYAFDPKEIRDRLRSNGLQLVLFNMPPGDWDAGERGIACHPDRIDDFRAGVEQALRHADVLQVPRLHAMSGIAPAGVDAGLLRRTLVDNLRHAAAAFRRAGLQMMVEPINHYDIPGYWLNRTQQAIDLLDEVGADNAFLQYDIYHAQRTEGELAATIARHLPRIGHMQLADNPGRHEPGTGEINWEFLFAHIDRIGYAGWIGCEYKPRASTVEGLGWRKPWSNA